MSIRERQKKMMEAGAANITKWVGSTASVTLHSILFVVAFSLPYAGIMSFERMLLFLTTIVSLEAIYLSIFIQMSINMNNQNIEIIQEDIQGLGEDIEEISEDIEDISEDIEDISDDIEELGEDIEEISEDIEEIQKDVEEIQEDVVEMQEEEEEETLAEAGSQPGNTPTGNNRNNAELLASIQATLASLQKEIELLKAGSK